MHEDKCLWIIKFPASTTFGLLCEPFIFFDPCFFYPNKKCYSQGHIRTCDFSIMGMHAH